jgi:hypothetical protein
MDLVKKMLEVGVARESEYAGLFSRVFNHIPVGRYSISVQCSAGHYCSPRESFPLTRLREYDSMEIMISKKGGEHLNIKRSSKFKKFPRYNELIERYDGMGVFGWVNVDLLEDLFDYLAK